MSYETIVMPTTELMLHQATEYAKLIPNLRNSITEGKGTFAGCLGEIALNDFLRSDNDSDSAIIGDYQYDIIYKGNKVEVKTKRTTVPPKSNYEASVTAVNVKQACDFYFFMRADERNWGRVWLCGVVTRQGFKDKSIFHKKGELDPDNNYTFKQDCYNISHSKMPIPAKMLDFARKHNYEVETF
jgi:hypothetical protein